MDLAVVILAAGQGTRMKSALPKVLHEAAGQPLLEHVLRAVQDLEPTRTLVVVGHGADEVEARFRDPAHHDLEFVRQTEQLGTGHALLQTRLPLGDFDGPVLVLNGDGPLLKTDTLRALIGAHQEAGEGMALLTCEVRDPTGLGRIVRDDRGQIQRIVEEKDAGPQQKAIHEINPGIYLFDADVFGYAGELTDDNAAGEYYVTDLVDSYLRDGKPVVAVVTDDETEILGVNTRQHLAEVERVLRDRIREKWLLAGVTMLSPEQTFIGDEVRLEPDVTLYPGVWLGGHTIVRRGAVIGLHALLVNCDVAENARVEPHSVLRDTDIS
ncbi:MAG: NTP transferase domain-containing protein [Trueperaceae bacterium]|nr:NTP transferase domain-containing protein [Trueperaceae bacterium]